MKFKSNFINLPFLLLLPMPVTVYNLLWRSRGGGHGHPAAVLSKGLGLLLNITVGRQTLIQEPPIYGIGGGAVTQDTSSAPYQGVRDLDLI
jgi:hypothetical protein